MLPPVVSFVGKSKSGKTTLLERLIGELKLRGYRVAVVKHHSKGDFEMDKPGKDSWRHAQAGADAVAVLSPVKSAIIRRLDREPRLTDTIALLSDADIVLTEGFKRETMPKIEVSRRERGTELICDRSELIAVAADHALDIDVPQFALDDISGIAGFLESSFFLRPQPAADAILPIDRGNGVSSSS